MSIELSWENGGKLVVVKLSGKLVKADYEQLIPEIEDSIRDNGKLNVLVIMHDFHGWEASALWEDIKFDVKHFRDLRRLAVVGEKTWEKWAASFCKPFTTAHVRYFEQNQEALARLWVQLSDEKNLPPIPENKPAAFGIYTSRSSVERAVEQLKGAGFNSHEISVLLPHKAEPPHVQETKATLGAEMGAGTGAVVGGLFGWLAGAGLLAIPGLTAAIIGGPFVTAFVSAATLGSLGGLWGGMVGLGIPEKEGRHFEGRLHKGDILLSVHCDDPERLMSAKEIMLHTGAEDIYSRHNAVLAATAS